MNAVRRFWREIAAGDFDRAAAELHPHVVVEWPHTGERFESRDAFLAVHRAIPAPRSCELRRVVTQGREVVSETIVRGDAASWGVASFFTLHDGRILHVVEYWVQLV